MGWPGEPRLSYTYDIIRLWELPKDLVLNLPYPDLWPISGAMAGTTLETVIEVGNRIVATDLPRTEKGELAELLVTFATLQIPAESVFGAIRRSVMIEELIRETGMYDYILKLGREEGEKIGEQRGEQRGEQQGVLIGRLNTLREMAVEQIAMHFPQADAALLDRIRTLTDQGVLRQIIMRIDDATDLAALESWLPSNI